MTAKRATLWIGGLLALLVGLAAGYYHFILDWDNRPYCHKQIMFGFMHWMGDQGMDINSHTNVFPNVNGAGADSLAAISNAMGGHMAWTNGYSYIPGLRESDPGDLILMYLDRPTRWTWHGPPPTIFKDKAWIVVPVDFSMESRPHSGPGEMSERVSSEEFQSRMRRTLDYLRTNERPHWETVVAEHTNFLNSIQRVER